MSGLSEKEAKKLGYDTVSVIITKKDKAGYMPEVENITIKLVADRRSHRILGAQAIGCGDADKKVNTISVGLMRRLTIEDLLDVDLTYAPPFSTSVDILHLLKIVIHWILGSLVLYGRSQLWDSLKKQKSINISILLIH